MIKINPEMFPGDRFENEGSEEKIKEKINATQSFTELLGVIKTIGGLRGSEIWHNKEELMLRVTAVMALSQVWPMDKFKQSLDKQTQDITRTAGLREKVEQLSLRIFKKREIEDQEEENE